MFYLKHFFKILAKSPIRSFFLFLFSVLLVFSLGQKQLIESQFLKLIPDSKAGASFYALISASESYESIATKVGMLPGVFKVEVLNEKQIQEEISNIFGSLQLEMNPQELDLNYAGIKVIFNKDLKPRSQDLIRDYLVRLGSEGSITLGSVKAVDSVQDKRAEFFNVLKKWGYSLYVLIVAIFWFISLVLVKTKIFETSYILQQYQRKNRIALKLAMNGLGLIFVFSLGITFAAGMPQLINILFAFAAFVVAVVLHATDVRWNG